MSQVDNPKSLEMVNRNIFGIVHGGDPEGSDLKELEAWFALREILLSQTTKGASK